MLLGKKKKVLIIEGMHCEHCKATVVNALMEISGVLKVKVNLAKGKTVVFSEDDIQDKDIKKAIAKTDFKLVSID